MSDAVEPFRAELLRIEVHYQGSGASIVVEGAFDTTGAERFVASVVRLPCQIIKSSRRLLYRLLSYSPWQQPLLAGVAAWRTRTQC